MRAMMFGLRMVKAGDMKGGFTVYSGRELDQKGMGCGGQNVPLYKIRRGWVRITQS